MFVHTVHYQQTSYYIFFMIHIENITLLCMPPSALSEVDYSFCCNGKNEFELDPHQRILFPSWENNDCSVQASQGDATSRLVYKNAPSLQHSV